MIIELCFGITLKECKELFIDYELIEREKAYRVYKNGAEVGTVTRWCNGTIDFWSHERERDIRIKELEELENILIY